MQLDWDEKVEPLPAKLSYVFQKVQSNERRLDLKLVLDQVYKFSGLPAAPAQNNHRQDRKSFNDKLYKSWQQTLLHLLRMQATTYLKTFGGAGDANSIKKIMQQTFQLTCEL